MKMTKEQREIYKSLIRLGDPKKLAYQTAIKIKPLSEEAKRFYDFAYKS